MSVVDLIKLAKDDIENPEDKKRIWIRVVCKIIVHIMFIIDKRRIDGTQIHKGKKDS